ncbi:MAG: NUDIX hydrolase [Chloroflexi bacterium]|nr:NUDIX hydrolase [Chloroflexota bacterium]
MKMKTYETIKDSLPELFDNSNALIKIIGDKNEVSQWQEQRRLALQEIGGSEAWADIGLILDDPSLLVLRDLVEFPGGYRNGYIRIYNRAYLEGGAAGVVVLPEKDGKILLFQHYRHATRMRHWEIPRGFGKSGVSAKTHAITEVREEINGEVEEIFELGIVYNNTGLEGNPINLFLARMASVGEMQVEEGIENPMWVSVPELEKMIADGEITDGFTVAAYTRAKLNGLI